jgi:hypothetical protein
MNLPLALIFGFASLTVIGLYLMDFEMHPKRSLAGIVAAMIGAIGLIVVASCAPSRAHDHNRPELNDWFRSLKSPGHGYCCDGSDALSVDDPDWEAPGQSDNPSGHYRVKLEGEWIDVPDDAVINEPNRDGRALVWPYRRDGKLNQIRCFLPGSMG